MDLVCRHCAARFRAAIQLPLSAAVRVACPSCTTQMVLRPAPAQRRMEGGSAEPRPAAMTVTQRREAPAHDRRAHATDAAVDNARIAAPAADRRATEAPPAWRPAAAAPEARSPKMLRVAVVADEARPFRAFLGEQLQRLGFEVTFFETGDATLDFVRRSRADLAIVNVYLKGKLGVEVTEEIKADPQLAKTAVVLIGALFRANRFRANPTNLYGADEYIEEQIPEKEFRQIIEKLFPEIGRAAEVVQEPAEYDEARRLARLILSDIVIYHAGKAERGIRDNDFFDVLKEEIEEGRQYYESRVSALVRSDAGIFDEIIEQFVQMKREELERIRV